MNFFPDMVHPSFKFLIKTSVQVPHLLYHPLPSPVAAPRPLSLSGASIEQLPKQGMVGLGPRLRKHAPYMSTCVKTRTDTSETCCDANRKEQPCVAQNPSVSRPLLPLLSSSASFQTLGWMTQHLSSRASWLYPQGTPILTGTDLKAGKEWSLCHSGSMP